MKSIPIKAEEKSKTKGGRKTREIEKEENLESKGREPKNQIGKEQKTIAQKQGYGVDLTAEKKRREKHKEQKHQESEDETKKYPQEKQKERDIGGKNPILVRRMTKEEINKNKKQRGKGALSNQKDVINFVSNSSNHVKSSFPLLAFSLPCF